jgi:hypothetical protein
MPAILQIIILLELLARNIAVIPRFNYHRGAWIKIWSGGHAFKIACPSAEPTVSNSHSGI